MDTDTSLFTLGDGITTSSTITLTRDSVPTDYLNCKVNVASSEMENNAENARDYSLFNPFIRFARWKDNKVKDCMEFFNGVIFVRERDEDISTHREFQDTQYHFYSLCNVGDSKKTDDSRVNDKNDPKEYVVEITDYNVPLAEFPTGYGTNNKEVCPESEWKSGNIAYDHLYTEYEYEDGEFKSFGNESYEFRYEMKGITEEQRQVNIDTWRDMYKFLATSTNEDFYTKLKEWFVVDSALYYYLFTENRIMVDNRAKNLFIHYGKVYISDTEATVLGEDAGGYIIDNEQAAIRNGYRYDFTFGYDFDTSWGIGNTGKLNIPYGSEDVDFYVDGDPTSGYIYRAAESTFFCRIRDLFTSELQAMYVDRENVNTWSSTRTIKQWDNSQSQFPEELYRLHYQRLYVRTYQGISIDNSFPGEANPRFLEEMMNGKKKYQRRMFMRNNELYFATKYFGKVATQDQIMMRFNNPVGATITPNFTLYITPYSNMYIGTSFGNVTPTNFRAKAGIEYTVPCSIESGTADITLIYGASFIQAIGDLSRCYVGDNDFSKASRLQSLVIGSDVDGYENSFMTKISLGNNKLLEYLDIRNITGLNSVVDLSQCGNLLELHAENSGATGIIFANGGKVEKAYIPAVTSLTVKNLNYLKEFVIASFNNLQTLIVENTPFIDTHNMVNLSPILRVLRLIGIDWILSNTDILNRILGLRGISNTGAEIETSVLAGNVHVPIIKQQELYNYNQSWSDLDVAYNTLIEQYPVTFVNYDGTVLDIQYVDKGSYAVDPIKAGRIDTPVKENTISTEYVFDKWDTNIESLQIFTAKTITAIYSESPRKYKIQYVSNGRILDGYPKEGYYGENIPYSGEIPIYVDEEGGYKYYLFNRWDKSGFLLEGKNGDDFDENGVKTVKAIFDDFSYTDPNVFKGRQLGDLKPVEIYALTKLTEPIDKTFVDYGMEIETGDDYSFTMGYDVDYDDIDSEELISEKKTFSGIEGDYYDTEVKLFDTDKDFVIALDYKMLSGNSTNATLMQCYQTSGYNGFKLSYESSPILSWGGKSVSTTGASVSPSVIDSREMLVIRHKQGDNNLYIYTSNLSTNSIKTYIIAKDSMTQSDTATLIFGAAKADNGRIANYAKGEVNWCKIWYKDLGEDTCRKLVGWTHEKITVEVSGFNRYQLYDDTTKESMISLLATHLLSVKEQYNRSSNDNAGGWANCKLNQFLNGRFYNAIPYQIKALIKKVSVKSTIGNNSTDISESGCFINVPALYDVFDGADNKYKSELYEFANTINFFTGFTDATETTNRVRKYDGEIEGGQYWLRSPSINTWATSRYCYSISKSGTPQEVTGTNTYNGILIEVSF